MRGDAKFKLEGPYSHYSGKYSETQFANNTNVGNPDFKTDLEKRKGQ